MEQGVDTIKRFDKLKNEPERSNFNIIWQDAAEFCSPNNDNINEINQAGEEKNHNRYIDIGIRCNNIFTAGISSNLIPAGSKFFEYSSSNPKFKNNDAVKRYWSDVTSVTYDVLNASNFFQEATKCINQLGYIGTCCLLTEPSKDYGIRFKSYFIDNYYIVEDAYGMIDTVYFEMKLSVRQAYQLFGEDLSTELKDKLLVDEDSEVIIIHAVQPRTDYERGATTKDKRPIKSCYVEYQSKHVIREDGYYEMPFAVGRFDVGTNEKYGRSPAINSLITLGLVNTMEQTRINSAELVSNPPWLVPHGSIMRQVSNQPGSIITYDPTGGWKPEQLTLKNNISVNDEAIRLKKEEIEDMFLVPLFNPLINRQNMTAFEVDQRTVIATQNLVPAIGRLTMEFLAPIFKRIYKVLMRAGYYPDMPEDMNEQDIKVDFSSKATMAIRQLEMLGAYNTMEQVTFLAQFKPDVLDNFDMDALVRQTAYANFVPNTIIKSEYDVEAKRNQDAQQAAMEQQQMAMNNMAEAYSKTTETPQSGSAADMLMTQAGL